MNVWSFIGFVVVVMAWNSMPTTQQRWRRRGCSLKLAAVIGQSRIQCINETLSEIDEGGRSDESEFGPDGFFARPNRKPDRTTTTSEGTTSTKTPDKTTSATQKSNKTTTQKKRGKTTTESATEEPEEEVTEDVAEESTKVDTEEPTESTTDLTTTKSTKSKTSDRAKRQIPQRFIREMINRCVIDKIKSDPAGNEITSQCQSRRGISNRCVFHEIENCRRQFD